MTDSTDPTTPRIQRKRKGRVPATIDLPASAVSAKPADQPSAEEVDRINEAVAAEMQAGETTPAQNEDPIVTPPPPCSAGAGAKVATRGCVCRKPAIARRS